MDYYRCVYCFTLLPSQDSMIFPCKALFGFRKGEYLENHVAYRLPSKLEQLEERIKKLEEKIV